MNQFPTNPDGNAYKILVTPDMASKWYRTSPGNRRERQYVVKRYAGDMIANKWYVGNDAVIFDTLGRLRNAHHRLLAIVLSGCSVHMLVRSGVSEEEIASMDQGLSRTAVESLTGFGEDKRFGLVSDRDTHIMKMVLSPFTTERFSNETIGEAILDHREFLDFVINECFNGAPRNKGLIVPLLAVFVRAAYNRENWDKLRYAGQYLIDGGESIERQEVQRIPGTSYLKVLRDYLMATKLQGGESRRRSYAISSNCMASFLNEIDTHKPYLSKKLKEIGKDWFPLPQKSYLNNFRSGYTPNLHLVIALREASKQYQHNQLVTPQQVAQDIVDFGGKVAGANPVKSIATWFAKTVRNNSNQFKIDGFCVFTPEIEKENQKRVNHYRFRNLTQVEDIDYPATARIENSGIAGSLRTNKVPVSV